MAKVVKLGGTKPGMQIEIIVVHVHRYRWGHEKDFVPPITGIHLAALTPPEHDVRVVHQQVEAVDLETDADLVALSFFSGFAEPPPECWPRCPSPFG